MIADKDQADMLLWLAKEDSSAVGECRGGVLTALHVSGLVRVVRRTATGNHVINTATPLNDFDRVQLTDEGWRAVAQIRKRIGA